MLGLLLALTVAWVAAADQPMARLCDKEIQCRLSKKITIVSDDRGPLADAAAYLCDRIEVPLAFDLKAFRDDAKGAMVNLARGRDVSVATALQQVLDQASATYEIRDGKVVVVPKPKQKKR